MKKSFTKSLSFVHILMIIMSILAASSFPVVAIITDALSPELLLFLRFFLSALLFLPFIIRKKEVIPNKKTLFRYFILSLPLVVFFWCMFESLRYTSALNTGAIYTILPAITAILAYIINKELTGKTQVIGLIIGTIGALWIVFRGSLDSLLSLDLNYGDLIFFTGTLCLGFYNPLVKKFYKGEPVEVMTFWILLIGSLCLLLFSWGDVVETKWLAIDSKVYWGILYLSLFSTLITFFLLQYGVVRIGATKVSAYGFLTPIIVVIIGVLIKIETFELVLIPGMLLVLLALFFIQKQKVKT